MGEEKKLSNLEKYYAKFTPEQLAAKRKELAEKRKRTLATQKAARDEILKKAQAMLPEVIAQDILLAENKNYVPRQGTINKFKELLADGYMTVEELRAKHFSEMSDDGWHRLLKWVFKSNVAQVEDVGLELVRAKNQAVASVEEHLKELSRHVKQYKRDKKPVPLGLLERIYDAKKDLNKINMDWAKTLNQIGAFDDNKSRAPAFHLHLNTPRPTGAPPPPKAVAPEPIDVTPAPQPGAPPHEKKTVNLGELLERRAR